MELTLKRLLEQAKFTTTRKGYDQDEVDDFLDKAVAMATKVEIRLTQALAEAKTATEAVAQPRDARVEVGGVAVPTRSDEEIQAEIDAAVDERVQAHLAELAKAEPTPPAADAEAVAEEARRTLVLAQRTADAAVAEAREEAVALLARARDEATQVEERTTAEAELRRAEVASETEAARRDARSQLAGEIRDLEEARDNLRADVSVLESHVEEQRVQLRSAVGELQRLLEDPAAFRLAPLPELRALDIPDLSDVTASSDDAVRADHTAAGTIESTGSPVEAHGEVDPTGSRWGRVPDLPGPESDRPGGAAPVDHALGEPSSDTGGAPEGLGTNDDPTGSAPVEAHAPVIEVSHDTPGSVDVDGGPPTAPVAVLDLGLDDPPLEQTPSPSPSPSPSPDDSDDAFLAELRRAMADEEPLGPRDDDAPPAGPSFLDDDDRRGWRFGKRR